MLGMGCVGMCVCVCVCVGVCVGVGVCGWVDVGVLLVHSCVAHAGGDVICGQEG